MTIALNRYALKFFLLSQYLLCQFPAVMSYVSKLKWNLIGQNSFIFREMNHLVSWNLVLRAV